jgi:D-sedoheptulose 7-phosphate isomerase
MNIVLNSLDEAAALLLTLRINSEFVKNIYKFSDELTKVCFFTHGVVYTCGNGGSYCDAAHLAEELTGRFRKDRRPIGAIVLGDSAHVTCTANDYGFDHVFSRQVQSLTKQGDLLVVFSTSGNSVNLINAVTAAKNNNVRVVGLLGRDGGKLKNMCDLSIVIPGETSDRIQEMHTKILHIAVEIIERKMFPENYL